MKKVCTICQNHYTPSRKDNIFCDMCSKRQLFEPITRNEPTKTKKTTIDSKEWNRQSQDVLTRISKKHSYPHH